MFKKLLLLALTSSLIIGCTNNINTMSINTNNNIKKESIAEKTNNNLIVRFNDNATNTQIQKITSTFNIKSFEMISDELKIAKLELSNNLEKKNIKQLFEKNSLVKYVENDQIINMSSDYKIYPSENTSFSTKSTVKPNDSFIGLQWNLSDIEVDKAWSITTGANNILVAVIDSGVDPTHPDLIDNLLPLIDVWDESGNDDIYENGDGINFAGKDGNGHGTHVAGIIGAMINNSKGVAGIAGNVKILPIKATNYMGDTSASVITASILKAIENKVKIINLSIGGPKSETTQSLVDVVNLAIQKNIVFVSASGNESNRESNKITDVAIPAAYPNVITVAASTKYDKVGNYSNGGAEIEVTAPGGGSKSYEGEKIYSTWPTYITYEGFRTGVRGPYAWLSGTSMSCAHVSGIAALILTVEPNLTVQQVRIRILSTVTDIEDKGFDNKTGYGKVNAYKALMSNNHDFIIE